MGSFVPIWYGILVSWNSKEKAISGLSTGCFLCRLLRTLQIQMIILKWT